MAFNCCCCKCVAFSFQSTQLPDVVNSPVDTSRCRWIKPLHSIKLFDFLRLDFASPLLIIVVTRRKLNEKMRLFLFFFLYLFLFLSFFWSSIFKRIKWKRNQENPRKIRNTGYQNSAERLVSKFGVNDARDTSLQKQTCLLPPPPADITTSSINTRHVNWSTIQSIQTITSLTSESPLEIGFVPIKLSSISTVRCTLSFCCFFS